MLAFYGISKPDHGIHYLCQHDMETDNRIATFLFKKAILSLCLKYSGVLWWGLSEWSDLLTLVSMEIKILGEKIDPFDLQKFT